MSQDSRLQRVISQNVTVLLTAIEGFMTEVPDETCKCGKPVVFAQGSRAFNCTRCGAEYELIVEIKQTKTGDTV